MLRAIDRFGMQGADFSDWGVLGAPIFFGRGGNAGALKRYAEEGAFGISPQMIPHWSQHALPGTISMVLKSYGPNFAVGNGPEAFGEGIMLAASVLSEKRLPGLWLVLTRHAPEFLPIHDVSGSGASEVLCEAAALALTPVDGAAGSLEFLFGVESNPVESKPGPPLDFSALCSALETDTPRGRWSLPGFGWFGIETRPAATEALR